MPFVVNSVENVNNNVYGQVLGLFICMKFSQHKKTDKILR